MIIFLIKEWGDFVWVIFLFVFGFVFSDSVEVIIFILEVCVKFIDVRGWVWFSLCRIKVGYV